MHRTKISHRYDEGDVIYFIVKGSIASSVVEQYHIIGAEGRVKIFYEVRNDEALEGENPILTIPQDECFDSPEALCTILMQRFEKSKLGDTSEDFINEQ